MKQLVARIALSLSVRAFDMFYDWVDTNNDGKICKSELLAKAKIIDKKSRSIVRKLKK